MAVVNWQYPMVHKYQAEANKCARMHSTPSRTMETNKSLNASPSETMKQQTALYYQFPGDGIIMSGDFNLKFWHGVPAVDSWQALFKRHNIVRMLPQNELDEANRVIKGEMNERFNVTIRWHESHFDGCPYLCGTAAQIAVPQAPSDVSSLWMRETSLGRPASRG